MRYVILVCLVALALALDLTVLISTSDDLLESFDPRHPATLVPIVAKQMHALATATGDLMRDLVEWFAAPYRARLHHTLPVEPALQ